MPGSIRINPNVTDAQYDEIVGVLVEAADRGVVPDPEPEPEPAS